MQGPTETIQLSKTLFKIARQWGYKGSHTQFRSDIHIFLYFIVGLVTIIWFSVRNKSPIKAALTACAIGLADETIKIFLPTREFSFTDLIKDIGGAAIALFFFLLIISRKRKKAGTSE